ncbi:serine/threonine-protein kinase [Pyxidicoccus xibeiensis]|uniref:serine/threonine-protein kinase n=1 Tax=Pyxidicoccus xibeiensis TaxID=2906759 RepID=UPI0020A7242A|nr:serine/threonine-protein kinase [Pyxidicoccus xibeiensis]MCP3145181.1 protein kinase [Pyxidicoccus xibeiensis]
MSTRHEEDEAELRMAVAEGLISREEARLLREQARTLSRGPLELLAAQGRYSEETLAPLLRAAREAAREREAREQGSPTLPLSPSKKEDTTAEEPAFPVPHWERYQCVRFLGQGGMGQVFLAHDARLRRDVALKFVRGEDAALVRHLLSEARAQARVEHERVCQVYEVGEVQGRPFIAMQYVDGQPLHHLRGELGVEQKALLLREAAEAVHAAHRAGLIHRDLKPSNILVERTEDGRFKPFVMDFGLARDWTELGATATGAVLGTPHYMSPEQARGEVKRLDRRADVYGLGATLYHLLTGQPPIPGENGLEVLTRISTQEPLPPRALDPDIPVDLEAIVLKCLEKDRSARYDSARALAEDLDRFLRGEPVHARPVGPLSRLRRRLRKHRLVVGVAVVALLLVGGALGWAGLTRREASRREGLARRFTERVERIEALARYTGLSRLHDTRADRALLRARMAELDAEIREAGALAVGPGHYALGRGHLALGDDAAARTSLEAAWSHGFREPRVAYALALALGRQYQERLLEAERLRGREQREARLKDLQREYREPALDWLRRSEGADVPSTDYVAALLAFYEGRHEEALERLDALGDRLPWFHEAPLLRGDILQARAARRWNQGDREGALADFDAGRRAHASAAATAESEPDVHESLARLEYTAMVMELYGQGDVLPPFTRGMEAVGRALKADPGHPRSLVLKARFHNRLAEHRMRQGGDVEGPLGEAMATARVALALVPPPPKARSELAQSLWRRARFQQGRGLDPGESLRQAVDALAGLRPEEQDYEFHALLGLIYKTWADYEDQTGVDSRPHRGQAIAAYREAIRVDERLPDAWINLGIAFLTRATHAKTTDSEGDLEQARLALARSRELNPGNYVPYFLGGTLHAELARRRRDGGGDARPDLATAAELFQRGAAINAQVAQLHNGLGSTLLEQARETWERGGDPFPVLEQARAAYARAVAVAPREGFGHNNLGEVHVERATYRVLAGEAPDTDLREAEAAYLKAIDLLPGLALPRANLARARFTRALFELERGTEPHASLDGAEEALRGAFERNAQEAQAWLYQGEVRGARARWRAQRREAREEDFGEAARAFEKALELEPRRLDVRVAFGHFCREWALWRKQAGQDTRPPLTRGLALTDAVLAARPEWADALLLRAALGEVAGEARSREDLVRALALNPGLEPWWKRRFARRLATAE